jgi:uncharacterized membrane protein YkoI
MVALAASFLVTDILAKPAAPPPAAASAPLRVILVADEGLVPLPKVLSMLRKQYSGRQLDAQIVRNPGIVLYEIQWLTEEGRKIVFIVNARDGKIVATRGL